MLVLTRKKETWIEMYRRDDPDGVRIKLMVLGLKSDGGVVVGIDAPRDWQIVRGPEHEGTSPPEMTSVPR